LTEPRQNAHGQGKEPFLEKILLHYRIFKVSRHINPDSNILDIGCGFNAKLLQEIEYKIRKGVGIDLAVSPDFCSNKIILMDCYLINELPFQDNEFNVVTSLANLEHFDNPINILKEIYRVLKPNGILLLTAPSIYAKPVLEFLCRFNLISKQEIIDHKMYFTKKILIDYSRQAGFSLIEHNYFQLGMNNFLIAKKETI